MFIDLVTSVKGQNTSVLASEVVEVRQMEEGKTLIVLRHATQGFYVKEDRASVINQIKLCLKGVI